MPGDILVVPVIDPGLAPLFGIAGGLIAEMGGTLSHGAIIAREYGCDSGKSLSQVIGNCSSNFMNVPARNPTNEPKAAFQASFESFPEYLSPWQARGRQVYP